MIDFEPFHRLVTAFLTKGFIEIRSNQDMVMIFPAEWFDSRRLGDVLGVECFDGFQHQNLSTFGMV